MLVLRPQQLAKVRRQIPSPSKLIEECPYKGGGFTGTLRGEAVTLPGVTAQRITYTKRNRQQYDSLRQEFNDKKRAQFVKELAADPKKVGKLKQAGLTETDIKQMQDGLIPEGWQVHHKVPLDDGGTNNSSNLLLIKNEPSHKVLTNAQKDLVGDLKEGQTRTVSYPVPDGFVYPPKQGMVKSP